MQWFDDVKIDQANQTREDGPIIGSHGSKPGL